MAEFLGDIAFMIEVLVLGLGLLVLHHAKKEKSKLVSASGWIMSVVATLGMLCTGFFYMKYFLAGSFSLASPTHHMMMHQNRNQSMMGNHLHQCLSGGKGKMMDTEMMGQMQNCMMHGPSSGEPKTNK